MCNFLCGPLDTCESCVEKFVRKVMAEMQAEQSRRNAEAWMVMLDGSDTKKPCKPDEKE